MSVKMPYKWKIKYAHAKCSFIAPISNFMEAIKG
jgi:hypothetical protein